MDCRSFRKRHLAYVDDTLPGIEQIAMRRHVERCEACAAMDTDVRRSLLVCHNNRPSIEPSADFSARLQARLEQERRRMAAPAPLFRGPPLGGFLAMSAGVVSIGLLAIFMGGDLHRSTVPSLPAVVIRPEEAAVNIVSPLSVSPPAFVASVSTGMAIWPALLLVEESPSRYANEGGSTPTVNAVNYVPGAAVR